MRTARGSNRRGCLTPPTSCSCYVVQVAADPHARALLAEQEQRIRADPQLSAVMAQMQRLFVPQGEPTIPRAPGPGGRARYDVRDEL